MSERHQALQHTTAHATVVLGLVRFRHGSPGRASCMYNA
jgi:hypothetical protein